MSTSTTIKQVMRALAALQDPKMRVANERRGDDHGVNLTYLRALAKRVKTQHELALQLWATGDTAAAYNGSNCTGVGFYARTSN